MTTHLHGEYFYPPELRRKVESIMSYTSRRLVHTMKAPPGWITLYEAATLMPHRPTHYKAYSYAKHRLLKSAVHNGITCTKPAWVESFLRRKCKLPPTGLGVFRSEAWVLLAETPTSRFWKFLKSYPSRCFGIDCRPIAMAFEVRDAAERADLPFNDCGSLVRLATESQRRFVFAQPRDLVGL